MKRDLNSVLMNAYGKEFEPSMKLEAACFQAMNVILPKDDIMSAEEKLSIYRIGKKIAAGGVADFSAEDLVQLKNRVARTFGAMAVGAIFDLLDGDFVEPVKSD